MLLLRTLSPLLLLASLVAAPLAAQGGATAPGDTSAPPDTTTQSDTSQAASDSAAQSTVAQDTAARDTARDETAATAGRDADDAETPWTEIVRLILAGIAILALGAGMILFGQAFLNQVKEGHTPGIETHWGGFGGGLGGWRLSPSLTYLIGALAFGAMLTAVALKTVEPAKGAETSTASEKADEKAAEPAGEAEKTTEEAADTAPADGA